MTGSKRVNHRTSGTVYECSEIAGSPQNVADSQGRGTEEGGWGVVEYSAGERVFL